MLSLPLHLLHVCTPSDQIWQIFTNMCRFTVEDIPTDLNELNNINFKEQALLTFGNKGVPTTLYMPLQYTSNTMITAVAAVFSCIYLQLRLRQRVQLETNTFCLSKKFSIFEGGTVLKAV